MRVSLAWSTERLIYLNWLPGNDVQIRARRQVKVLPCQLPADPESHRRCGASFLRMVIVGCSLVVQALMRACETLGGGVT